MTGGTPRWRATHATHEVFFRDEEVSGGSNRSFGVVMASALAAVAMDRRTGRAASGGGMASALDPWPA
jgi:hypothetical protein